MNWGNALLHEVKFMLGVMHLFLNMKTDLIRTFYIFLVSYIMLQIVCSSVLQHSDVTVRRHLSIVLFRT